MVEHFENKTPRPHRVVVAAPSYIDRTEITIGLKCVQTGVVTWTTIPSYIKDHWVESMADYGMKPFAEVW